MHTLLLSAFIIAAIKWGDWKNWKLYYPTFLFFIIGDLLYQFLLYKKTMWMFHPSIDRAYLPNHTVISLVKMFIRYGATILIFFGHFPATISRRLLWILFWVILYFSIEIIAIKTGIITHHNGWNLYWSFYMDIVIFVIISIHFKNPLLAWLLALVNLVFLWITFGLTLDILK